MLWNPIFIFVIIISTSAREIGEANESLATNTNNDGSNVCNHSLKCRRLADLILKRMNPEKDPCDDFYEYANGNKESAEPFAQRDKISPIIGEIREILENGTVKDMRKSLSIEKQLFRVCMDRGNKRTENVHRLFSLIDSAGGLRSIAPKPVSDFSKNWQEVDNIYSKLGFKYAFFDVIRQDDKSKSELKSTISITPPIWRKKAVKLIRMLYNLEWDNNLSILDDVIKVNPSNSNGLKSRVPLETMEAFGSEIDKIVSEVEKNVEKIEYSTMNISEWQNEYDQAHTSNDTAQINWLDLIKNLLSIVNFDVSESEIVKIAQKEYFKKLANILQSAPMDVLTSYVHLNFLSRILSIARTRNEEKEWMSCLMSSDMVAVYYEYITLHKLQANRELAGRMTDEIKKYMFKKAHDKWPNIFTLHNDDKVETVIGYPEWIHNRSIVEHYYDDFEVTDNAFQNLVNSVQFSKKKELMKLRNPEMHDRYPSEMLFNDMNGGIFDDNKIIYSTEYLVNSQYGLFDAKYPSGINYGALGSEIGQLQYAMLENEGIKNGLVKMIDNDACIKDQIDTDEMTKDLDEDSKGVWLKQLMIGNSILDIFKVLSLENDNKKLPGLETFTSQQLFFIAFADNLCASGLEFKDSEKHHLLNTMFSNMEEFSTAFKCSNTSRMNRQNKCFK